MVAEVGSGQNTGIAEVTGDFWTGNNNNFIIVDYLNFFVYHDMINKNYRFGN